MRLLTAIVNISNHKAKFVEQEKFDEAYKKLEGTYLVTFEKIYKKRSGKQNRTVWGLAYKLLQDALITSGDEDAISMDYVHLICKENCLPFVYVERLKEEYNQKKGLIHKSTGEIIKVAFRLTTTKMTTVEWMEYYQNIQLFGQEYLNITIPDIQSYDAL